MSLYQFVTWVDVSDAGDWDWPLSDVNKWGKRNNISVKADAALVMRMKRTKFEIMASLTISDDDAALFALAFDGELTKIA